MESLDRRSFLGVAAAGAAWLMPAGLVSAGLVSSCASSARAPGSRMRFGLVTYLWGRAWDLPTLIDNCERTGVLGVELRTTHAHGVEPDLDAAARRAVRDRFAASPVTLVGLGSNEDFHHPDPARLRQSVQRAKAFLQLSHDVGGSGVKVKPNALPDGVAPERTLDQIGEALRELAQFADGLGQEVRLEVHGRKTSLLPNVRAIMQAADHPRAVVCWNCNEQDLHGEGLDHNFALVERWFGQTAHVREFDQGEYPYARLMELFVARDYDGWILLEARRDPPEPLAALRQQRALWQGLVERAQASV